MKVLLIISIFLIQNVISKEEKLPTNVYPKKVLGQIFINRGKYANKPKTTNVKKILTNTDRNDTKYKMFRSTDQSHNIQGIPDSPYFPVEPTIIQKPRVKKVLPDYVWSPLARHKRSADTPVPQNENKTNNQPILFKSSDDTNGTKSITLQQPQAKKAVTEVTKLAKKEELNARKQFQAKGKIPSKNTPAKKAQVRAGIKNGAQKKSKIKQIARKAKITKVRGNAKPKRKAGGRKRTLKKSKSKQNRRSKIKKRFRQKPKTSLKLNKRSNIRKSKIQAGKSARSKISADTRRLYAAREASIEDYPYVVSIQKNGQHWCSGALLNPRLVITTANCVWKSKSMSRMQVRAGSSYADRGGQISDIQEVMKHPRWGLRTSPDNDVALLLVEKNFRFSHSVHAVDLPNRDMYPAFDDAWVVSWGAERRDGVFDDSENTLQVYHTMLMSHELCNNITSRFGVTVTANFICLSQSGRTSPCTRDTGAPAVSDGTLWGLASWGLRKLCGTERFPSMFSYIASPSNMYFIRNATSYLMADERLHPFPDRLPKHNIKAKENELMAVEIQKRLSGVAK